MLKAFILKSILTIPSIDLFITFLSTSPSIHNIYGFLRVTHKSQFSRSESEYLDDLNDLFRNLVNKTEDMQVETPYQ